MATRKVLSPLLLGAPLTVPIFYLLTSQLGICHAMQRQSPLTMSTGLSAAAFFDGSGRGSVHLADKQCSDPLDTEEAHIAVDTIASSRKLDDGPSSKGDQPGERRGEAQRCLLSSSASLMRQQHHLAPEANDFACATKHLMAAAPPPGITFFQSQQPHPGHQHPQQQQSQQKLQQQQQLEQNSDDSQEYHQQTRGGRASRSSPPPNIAFDWRNSFRSSAAASQWLQQGIQRIPSAASTVGESAVVAVPRDKQASSVVASPEEKEQDRISFYEALSHAAAAEAAALAGGAWDWSTWGIDGLYQSLPSALIKRKQTARGASTATAADAEFALAPAPAAPDATDIAGADAAAGLSGAESPPAAAPGEMKSATRLASAESAAAVATPPPGARSSAASLSGKSPTGGVFVESGGVTTAGVEQQQQHQLTSAEAAEAKKISSSTSNNKINNESSWWAGGQTWSEAIGSFFKKLDKRIDEARGVLSYGDMYEFSL